jgi:hypothetical protein
MLEANGQSNIEKCFQYEAYDYPHEKERVAGKIGPKTADKAGDRNLRRCPGAGGGFRRWL